MEDLNLPELLEKRLLRPLPGEEAHYQMRARQTSGEFINFKDQANRRYGAVMILLYRKDRDWYFPVIKRPEYDGVHGGQISLPGGKVEEGDGDLFNTALRETREEIGINGDDVRIVGKMTSFYVGASNYEVLPVIGHLDYPPSFDPDPEEVAEVIEIPLTDLLSPAVKSEKEIEVRGFRLIAPYFDIKSQFIWGATAMMLNELKTLINDL